MDDDGITDDLAPAFSAVMDLYFKAVFDWERVTAERNTARLQRNKMTVIAGCALITTSLAAGTAIAMYFKVRSR